MEVKYYLKALSNQELTDMVNELQNQTQFDDESPVRKAIMAIYGEINIMALQVNLLTWPLAIELSKRLAGSSQKSAEISENKPEVKVLYNDKVNVGYQIIEVDGVAYIASLSGGITPLIKPNNNKGGGQLYS